MKVGEKMKNKIIIGAFVLVVIFVGAFFLMPKKSSSPAVSEQVTQSASQDAVSIQNFAFSPEILTVRVGAKVTWANNDSTVHTIKSDSFNSAELKQGDKFEFTFAEKGSFDYSCGIHPSMKGKVIVE